MRNALLTGLILLIPSAVFAADPFAKITRADTGAVVEADGDTTPAEVGREVFPSDRLVCGPGATCVLELVGGGTVTIHPNSQIGVRQADQRLDLEEGAALIESEGDLNLISQQLPVIVRGKATLRSDPSGLQATGEVGRVLVEVSGITLVLEGPGVVNVAPDEAEAWVAKAAASNPSPIKVLSGGRELSALDPGDERAFVNGPGMVMAVRTGWSGSHMDLADMKLGRITDVAAGADRGLIFGTTRGVVLVQGGREPTWLLSLPADAPPVISVAWRLLGDDESKVEEAEVAYLTEGSGEVRSLRVLRVDGAMRGTEPTVLAELPSGAGFGPLSIVHESGPNYVVAATRNVKAPKRPGMVYRIGGGREPQELLKGVDAPTDLVLLTDLERMILAFGGKHPRLVAYGLPRIPGTSGEKPLDPEMDPARIANFPGASGLCLGLRGEPGSRDLLVAGRGLPGVMRFQGPAPFARTPLLVPTIFAETDWHPFGLTSGGQVTYVCLGSQPGGGGTSTVVALGPHGVLAALVGGLPNLELLSQPTPGPLNQPVTPQTPPTNLPPIPPTTTPVSGS